MAVDDAYTKILLHGDGDSLASVEDFVDEAGNVWADTGWNGQTGNYIELDAGIMKFGDASIYLFTEAMRTALNSGLNPGSGDFTIDFQLRAETLPSSRPYKLLEWYGDENNRFKLEFWKHSGSYYYFLFEGYANGTFLYSTLGYNELPFTPSAETFYHIELVRNGNNYLLFADGALLDTYAASAHTYAMSTGFVYLYGNVDSGIWLDEVRYSVGIARHTDEFTPPTAAYVGVYSETINEALCFSDKLSINLNGANYYDVGILESLGLEEAISGINTMGASADDALGLAGELSVGLNGVTYHDVALASLLGMAETTDDLHTVIKSASDALDLADALGVVWGLTAHDALDIADANILSFVKILTDTLFGYDNANVGWNMTAIDALDIADTIDVVLGLIISDWLALADTETNSWNGQEIVTQPLNLYDLAIGAKHYADSLSDAIAIVDAPTLALTVAILEHLGFSGLATALKTMAQALSDTMGLADSPAWAFPLSVTSALDCVDAATVATAFLRSIQSDMGLADAVTPIKRTSATVTSPLVFADTVGSAGAFYNILYDTLAMNVLIELDGEIYECYVLSTPKFMPSVYSGFDFNSYAVFQNRAFGANSTGIYELIGDTDAGAAIHSGVILSGTNFDLPNQKRFRKGFLDVSGAAPLMMFETEEGNRRVYSIDTQGKVVASHEQKSKKWKLSLAEFDSLESIQLVPIILTK